LLDDEQNSAHEKSWRMFARQQENTISKREAAKKKAAGPGTAGPAGELLERLEVAFVRR
jgi:hypothetical protein